MNQRYFTAYKVTRKSLSVRLFKGLAIAVFVAARQLKLHKRI